ncbi:MAG: PHP domain-containing protein [Bacteroidota bacterium]
MLPDLFQGRVLFHCHTHYTDGTPTADDYVRWAAARDLDRVVFLEHIRRAPTYDVGTFAEEVQEAGKRHEVPVVLGFEAKVLPGGALDIADEHLALAAVIGVAEHAFPEDITLWDASLRAAFAFAGSLDVPAVWVHPGLRLQKWHRLDAEQARYASLLDAAQDAGLLVEQNARYRLVPDDVLPLVRPECLVRGIDAHRIEDVERFFAP